MKVELTFTLTRETKGALRYDEVPSEKYPYPGGTLMTSMYLRKESVKAATGKAEWPKVVAMILEL